VFAASLQNHLYGITQIKKKGKAIILSLEVHPICEKKKGIGHPHQTHTIEVEGYSNYVRVFNSLLE
jgi:hypothetical protein